MLPITVLLLALLGGCHSKKVLDESQYVSGDTQEQLNRAHSLVEKNQNKEALIQLYALEQTALTSSQNRWVRDEIVKIYNQDRDYEKLIVYLAGREHLKQTTPSEQNSNLFEKAEAYHHLSYNYWARKLGMGSPYRRSKAAFKAKEYYHEFLTRYPNDPKCAHIRKELIGLESYIERYERELKEYQDYRAKPN